MTRLPSSRGAMWLVCFGQPGSGVEQGSAWLLRSNEATICRGPPACQTVAGADRQGLVFLKTSKKELPRWLSDLVGRASVMPVASLAYVSKSSEADSISTQYNQGCTQPPNIQTVSIVIQSSVAVTGAPARCHCKQRLHACGPKAWGHTCRPAPHPPVLQTR